MQSSITTCFCHPFRDRHPTFRWVELETNGLLENILMVRTLTPCVYGRFLRKSRYLLSVPIETTWPFCCGGS